MPIYVQNRELVQFPMSSREKEIQDTTYKGSEMNLHSRMAIMNHYDELITLLRQSICKERRQKQDMSQECDEAKK